MNMDRCKFIICMVFVFSLGIDRDRSVKAQNSPKECFTPNNLNGNCMNIKRCPTLRSLLKNQRHISTIATFLRNSLCGYDGRDPMVCCPLENKPTTNTDTTQRITTPILDSTESAIYGTVSSIKLPSQHTCGRTNSFHTHIFGGQPAELGDWPWVVALGYQDLNRPNSDYQWLCEGSLLSDSHVLTAAHCIDGIAGKFKLDVVRLGDLNLDPKVDDGAKPINVKISSALIHRQFNVRNQTNDIGILKLKNSVSFNEFIQPICLPVLSHHRANKFYNSLLYSAGWGSTSYGGPKSSKLMEVQLPVVDNLECKRAYANENSVIDNRVLCAGSLRGGKDTCQGDSGGPLMWPNGNQYYVVGVVSHGYKCAEIGYPGVYTRVGSFIEWIVDKINNS